MTALCSIYYLHLFTFLLFFATLFLTLYFLFFNFTSNSLLNLLFSSLFFIFLPFIFQESFRDARRTHTNNTHAVCRDFPNYLPFALSPFEFLPLFAKTIASFSLSILLFRHARTHTYQSSPQTTHNLRLLKIFPTDFLTTLAVKLRVIGTGSLSCCGGGVVLCVPCVATRRFPLRVCVSVSE